MRICIPGPPSLLPPSHFETKARGIIPVPSSFFLHRTPSVHLQTTKKKGHGHAESRTRPPSRFFVPPPSNPGTGLRPRAAFLFTRPLAVRLSSKHPPQRTTSTHIRVPSPPKPQYPIPTPRSHAIPRRFRRNSVPVSLICLATGCRTKLWHSMYIIRWNEVRPSSPITPTFFWLTTWPHSTRLNPCSLYIID